MDIDMKEDRTYLHTTAAAVHALGKEGLARFGSANWRLRNTARNDASANAIWHAQRKSLREEGGATGVRASTSPPVIYCLSIRIDD